VITIDREVCITSINTVYTFLLVCKVFCTVAELLLKCLSCSEVKLTVIRRVSALREMSDTACSSFYTLLHIDLSF
jgi:hypothetical protein